MTKKPEVRTGNLFNLIFQGHHQYEDQLIRWRSLAPSTRICASVPILLLDHTYGLSNDKGYY